MESIGERNKICRQNKLEQWLTADCGLHPVRLQAMPGDASFRRYFRIHTATQSFVAMDAPPPQENCAPFVAIAAQLGGMGLQVPAILAANLTEGFLLLTDFGDLTYLKELNPNNADQLYGDALAALSILQRCRRVPNRDTPLFTREWMWQEWQWHKEWFLGHLLNLDLGKQEKALDHCVELIVANALAQPQVFMHRDYHSANLMVLPNQQVGILDFQDAFIGPVTYDLVSLLRDCYIDWPQERITPWVLAYKQRLPEILANRSSDEFLRDFDWMGVQRHLKALFTFARKAVRDQQPRYRQYIPRTLNYILQVSECYPELQPLHQYFNTVVRTQVLSCGR